MRLLHAQEASLKA